MYKTVEGLAMISEPLGRSTVNKPGTLLTNDNGITWDHSVIPDSSFLYNLMKNEPNEGTAENVPESQGAEE